MRKQFGTVLLLLTAACFVAAANAKERLPNIIVILADDLGYGDLGCYGSNKISTPRLDRMAAEGIRFTSFYVTASICSPSRASLLTGRYAQRAGMPFVLFPTERKGLPPEETTIAELLKQRGYATACIGKWHLGTQPPFWPLQQGFDYFFGLPYSNDSLKQPEHEPFQPVLAPVDLPLMRNNEVIEAPVRQETLTERYTEEALQFIRQNRDRPFFIYLPHTFPHKPLFASEKFRGKSKGGLYGDTVEALDWSTGKILDALKEIGIDEQTLVIFTSDNGPAPSGRLSDQGGGSAGPLRGGKFNSYEGGFRVPAIFRWPTKIPGGGVCDELATSMDLLPTIGALTRGKLPKAIDGKNIWPLLIKPTTATPHDAFYYYLDNQLQAVRSGPWKLFLKQETHPKLTTIFYEGRQQVLERHFPLRPTPELYNLEKDIGEKENVAEQNVKIVKRLTKLAGNFDRELQRNKRPEQILP